MQGYLAQKKRPPHRKLQGYPPIEREIFIDNLLV